MTLPKSKLYKQITLNIPTALLSELDQVSTNLKRPRAHVIVRSLERDLRGALRQEAVRAHQQQQELDQAYGGWLITSTQG